MVIVYTEKQENALLMAAFLGGISYNGKLIKDDKYEEKKAEIIEETKKEGYIRSVLKDTSAVFVWGENLLRPFKMNEYGKTVSTLTGFVPKKMEIRPFEGKEHEVENIVSIIQNEAHPEIYDATLTIEGEQKFALLYQYANCNKPVYKVRIKELSRPVVKRAFDIAEDPESYGKIILKNQFFFYAHYLANGNLPIILSKNSQSPYPRVKDMMVLNSLIERQKEIIAEKEKNYFSIIPTVSINGKEIIFTNKEEKFKSKKEAEEKVANLPSVVQLETACKEKKETAKGPHSINSIEKEANEKYGYTKSKTDIILNQLFAEGYITTASTASRKYPREYLEPLMLIIKKLGKTKAFNEAVQSVKELPFTSKYISDDKASGILPTKKPLDPANMNTERRNIYFLICKAMLGPFIGEYVEKNIEINVLSYKANISYVEKNGFKALDGVNIEPPLTVPEKADNISYKIESAIKDFPKPKTKKDVLKENEELWGKLFTVAEFDDAIDRLSKWGYLVEKNGVLIPSVKTTELIAFANNFSGLTTIAKQISTIINGFINNKTLKETYEYYIENCESLLSLVENWYKEADEVVGRATTVNCPKCRKKLYSNSKGLNCRYCDFKLQRVINGRNFDDLELANLLTKGETPMLSGFGSKYGRVIMENMKPTFTQDSYNLCPVCGSPVREKGNKVYCYKCGFLIPKNIMGYNLTEEDIEDLLVKRKTKPILFNNGQEFKGVLYIIDGKIKCIKLS